MRACKGLKEEVEKLGISLREGSREGAGGGD
jgi:hypothetical protein